nr:thiamine pyrophosphate-dependent enzyme [Acinetobacter baumannii]
MGGEGVSWVGASPFTNEKHIFANLGDGTYFHSGYLAIRQSIAAKTNITYKILYNDAVAMTGGQHVDGHLDPSIFKIKRFLFDTIYIKYTLLLLQMCLNLLFNCFS